MNTNASNMKAVASNMESSTKVLNAAASNANTDRKNSAKEILSQFSAKTTMNSPKSNSPAVNSSTTAKDLLAKMNTQLNTPVRNSSTVNTAKSLLGTMNTQSISPTENVSNVNREKLKVFKDNLKSLVDTPMDTSSFKIKFKSMMDQFASL